MLENISLTRSFSAHTDRHTDKRYVAFMYGLTKQQKSVSIFPRGDLAALIINSYKKLHGKEKYVDIKVLRRRFIKGIILNKDILDREGQFKNVQAF